MSDIDPARLNRLLQAVATTEAEEMDCDSLFELMDKAVELAASGQDVRSLLPGMAIHLEHCPDCRDQFETLTAFWEEAPRSRWRSVKRIAGLRQSFLRRRQKPQG